MHTEEDFVYMYLDRQGLSKISIKKNYIPLNLAMFWSDIFGCLNTVVVQTEMDDEYMF